ncbi:MAG: hypothetical protein WCV86_00760 [Patescibacteria group bacterium]|jgi:thiosulfate dehydrogenase [quinone] large subunit
MEKAKYLIAIIRISMGWIFLWAFIDKLAGLGFATESAKSWLNGGSPTLGFLKFGTSGPFADFYQSLAGQGWVDWLFMLGLAGIGLALLFGVGLHIASITGTLLLFMMYTAVLPPENNPFMDEHIIYALVLLALPMLQAGHTWGIGQMWNNIPFVQKNRWLQ